MKFDKTQSWYIVISMTVPTMLHSIDELCVSIVRSAENVHARDVKSVDYVISGRVH
jgi:hypothetical protein